MPEADIRYPAASPALLYDFTNALAGVPSKPLAPGDAGCRGFFFYPAMKYFLHDTNAFQDEKIAELFIAHGYEGLGLFYSILEKLAYQEKPVKTAVLKKQLSVGKKLEKCWSFLESIDLISSNNGETFNNNLLKFSEKYQVSKEKNRERVAQWREKQSDTKPVTHYEHVRNGPKEKISKVKETPSNEGGDPPAPALESASLKADKPDAPRRAAATFRPDEAPVFTMSGLRAFADRIGFRGIDVGHYLPLMQRVAEKTGEQRPNDGPGKTWEDFVTHYLEHERKYNRVVYPVAPGQAVGYAAPNPALQVTTSSTSYSPAAIAARNVVKY